MKSGMVLGRSGLVLAAALMVGALTGCGNPAGSGEAAAAPDGKKLIGAHLKIKADQVDAFVAAAKDVIAASRAEPGCIGYTLYQDPYEPTAFFFFEQWKDQAAIDFHFGTPHFKAFGDKLKDMADGAADITIYSITGEKRPGG